MVLRLKKKREREREREGGEGGGVGRAYVGVVGIIEETAVENSSSSKLCIFSSLAIMEDPGYKYG
jgi:hypothetical protein